MDLTERVLRVSEFEYCDMIWWRYGLYQQPDDKVHFLVNCNDVFHWACADAEEITEENIGLLEETMAEVQQIVGSQWQAWDAFILWCARVREMRPQGAMYKNLDHRLWPLFDACGPVRDADLGNPRVRPEDIPDRQKEHEHRVKEVAAELLLSDTLTPASENGDEYYVDPENIEYLVNTVVKLYRGY